MLASPNLMRMYQGGPPPTMRQACGAVSVSNHGVIIQRRTGSTFVDVAGGALILPGEAIRIKTTGVDNAFPSGPIVSVTRLSDMQLVFGPVNIGVAPFTGTGHVDLVAPTELGEYQAKVMAQTFPVLPIRHDAFTSFTVSPDAPPPPDPAPSPFPKLPSLDDLKPVLYIILGIVAISALAPVATKLIPDRRG